MAEVETEIQLYLRSSPVPPPENRETSVRKFLEMVVCEIESVLDVSTHTKHGYIIQRVKCDLYIKCLEFQP